MTSDAMKRWRGRVALVTGASSGIGAAVAIALSREGLKVALCARRAERLLAVASQCADAGAEVEAVPCDLRSVSAIERLFGTIRARWGGVDVLINSAGLGHRAPLTSGDAEQWREMLEVNVLGLCVCTREAVSDMRGRGDDGHVVHISSMAGHRVPVHSGVYSATKFAVRSLTEGLRQELRELESNIRVSAISPGFVETEFAERYNRSKDAAAKTYGRFKVLEARDIADTVVHVLGAPGHAQIHDVLVRPTWQPS